MHPKNLYLVQRTAVLFSESSNWGWFLGAESTSHNQLDAILLCSSSRRFKQHPVHKSKAKVLITNNRFRTLGKSACLVQVWLHVVYWSVCCYSIVAYHRMKFSLTISTMRPYITYSVTIITTSYKLHHELMNTPCLVLMTYYGVHLFFFSKHHPMSDAHSDHLADGERDKKVPYLQTTFS